MRFFRVLIPGVAALLALALSPAAQAQTQPDTTKVLSADSLGSSLLNDFNKDFDVVFKATKVGLEKLGYEVNYASKKRMMMETSFKGIATEDTFFEVMEKLGDIPYIRSPGWTIGRTKVSVTFSQLDTSRVEVKVQAIMSGYEARFTNQWHYWKSNGKIEQQAMDAIVAAVEATDKKSAASGQ